MNSSLKNIDPKAMRVFYDGLCKVCSKEIDIYRTRDTGQKIQFVDISDLKFDAKAEGLDAKTVQKVFHVKGSDEKLYKGVDGFVAIWDELDIFRPLSALAKFPMTRPLFDVGYFAFTKVRPILPRKPCPDGHCNF